MVFDGRFKYVSGAGPEPLLYDVMEDPGEFRNLAPDQPQTVERLAALCRLDLHTLTVSRIPGVTVPPRLVGGALADVRLDAQNGEMTAK
jgi:hypothetical protein